MSWMNVACWLLAWLIVPSGAWAQNFSDDFSVPADRLDRSIWTTEIGPGSFLGRTQLRDWVTDGGSGRFVVADGSARLALDTFNAGANQAFVALIDRFTVMNAGGVRGRPVDAGVDRRPAHAYPAASRPYRGAARRSWPGGIYVDRSAACCGNDDDPRSAYHRPADGPARRVRGRGLHVADLHGSEPRRRHHDQFGTHRGIARRRNRDGLGQ